MTAVDLSQSVYRKSTRSACDGACVEVAIATDVVGVRDSKNRDGGHLIFSHADWAAFVAAVRRGEFDLR